jgi:hypothetical protein
MPPRPKPSPDIFCLARPRSAPGEGASRLALPVIFSLPVLLLALLEFPTPLHAQPAWVAHYKSAKRAHDGQFWAACRQSAAAGFPLAPVDRQPGFAVLGARCAAREGDRTSFDFFVSAAGDRLHTLERQRLDALLSRLEAEREADRQATLAREAQETRRKMDARQAALALKAREVRRKEEARQDEETRRARVDAARHAEATGEAKEGRKQEETHQTQAAREVVETLTPPAPTTHRATRSTSGPAADLRLSLACGPVFADKGPYLSHANTELLAGWRASRLLRLDLAAALTLESPIAVTLRPGLRLFTGPVYWRAAYQWLATLEGDALRTSGALLGLGGEWNWSRRWFMAWEVDMSLWLSAISVVPIEGRLGIGLRL